MIIYSDADVNKPGPNSQHPHHQPNTSVILNLLPVLQNSINNNDNDEATPRTSASNDFSSKYSLKSSRKRSNSAKTSSSSSPFSDHKNSQNNNKIHSVTKNQNTNILLDSDIDSDHGGQITSDLDNSNNDKSDIIEDDLSGLGGQLYRGHLNARPLDLSDQYYENLSELDIFR